MGMVLIRTAINRTIIKMDTNILTAPLKALIDEGLVMNLEGVKALMPSRLIGEAQLMLNSRYDNNTYGHLKNQKRYGHSVSKYIATINKHDYISSHEHNSTIAVSHYLKFILSNYGTYHLHRLEPQLNIIKENFASRTWTYLDEDIFKGILFNYDNFHLIQNLHKLHISTVDESLIAYYPSLKHLREGREVRTRIGKYLSKYASLIYGDLDSNELASKVKDTVDRFNLIYCDAKDFEVEIISDDVSNKELWNQTYNSNSIVHSCMSNEDIGTAYCTGRGQLALAVVRHKNTKQTLARCIIRLHNDKVTDNQEGVIRFYPSVESSTASMHLKNYLADIGYSEYVSFEGIYLKTYEHDNGSFYAPYIDGGINEADLKYINDEPYFLVSSYGDYTLDRTDLIANDGKDYYSCDCCGDSVHEDDSTYISCDEVSVCDSCIDNYYRTGIDGEYIHESNAIYVIDLDVYVHQDQLDHHDIVYSEISHDYFHIDSVHYSQREDIFISLDDVIPVDFSTVDDDELIYRGHAVFLPCGAVVHKYDYDHFINLINEVK